MAVLIALSLTACASLYLDSDLPLLKIVPADLGQHSANQRIALTYGKNAQTFDAVVETDGEVLTVIGLAFGVRLFGLRYDGRTLMVDKPPPGGLSAQRIINDILLIAAPIDVLRQALPATYTASEEPGLRRIDCDDRPLVRIERQGNGWDGHATFDNLRLRYRFERVSQE